MAAAKRQRFLWFLYLTESSPLVIQSPRFTNDYEFGIECKYISVVDIPT